jgi:addiction module HigA family antidote
MQSPSTIFVCRRATPATGSKRFGANGKDNIRFASTTNGDLFPLEVKAMRIMSRSSTTTQLLPNPHPGEILAAEFLQPMSLSQSALARAIGASARRINEIVLGRRAITADTDLRLARYFVISACRRDFLSACRPTTN